MPKDDEAYNELMTRVINPIYPVKSEKKYNAEIKARDELSLSRLHNKLAKHKLLIIDEIGYVPLPAANMIAIGSFIYLPQIKNATGCPARIPLRPA